MFMLYRPTLFPLMLRCGSLVDPSEEFMNLQWTAFIPGSRCIAPLALSLALLGPAHAATIIFNNISDASIGGRTVTQLAQYQSFSTGAGSFSLTDVQLLLSGNSSVHSFSVDLYSNSSNTPGGLLDHIGSMNDSALTPSCNCIYDFPTAAFALSPSTRYWIGLSTVNGSDVTWSIEGPFQGHPGDIGVTGEFIDDSGTVSADTGEAFQMTVSVSSTTSSVPEPSAFLLVAIGLASLAIRGFRAIVGQVGNPMPLAFNVGQVGNLRPIGNRPRLFSDSGPGGLPIRRRLPTCPTRSVMNVQTNAQWPDWGKRVALCW
jgi:hypothetical protein